MDLNYHHLRYFRAVAHDGSLTRTAARLNLSQSALSSQIKRLEERLGHALFERRGRQLHLTEAGRIALDHADTIFAAGDELLGTLRETGQPREAVRIGALSTLSRNLQLEFLRPLLGRDSAEIVLRSGSARELFPALEALALHLVLTNQPPATDALAPYLVHRIADQAVGLFHSPGIAPCETLEAFLSTHPVILPTESTIRVGFDALVARLGIRPLIAAEVDDMAMIRLLAREGAGVAVVPEVVLRDELAAGRLIPAPYALDISESFYAVIVRRRFPSPLVAELLDAAKSDRAI